MPVSGSPNPRLPRPSTDLIATPERVIGINRNDCSSSIGTAARHQPVRATCTIVWRFIHFAKSSEM